MNDLDITEELVNALRDSIAALYGIPADAVNLEIGIFRSDRAYEEARVGEYIFHERQGSHWLTKGNSINGVCITVHRADYKRPDFLPIVIFGKNEPKDTEETK